MDYQEIHAQSIQSLIDSYGDAIPMFGWPVAPDGTALNWYPALTGPLLTTKTLGDGGFSIDADATIIVLAKAFADNPPEPKLPTGIEPQQKQTCLLKLSRTDAAPKKLRISTITFPAGRIFLEMGCNDPTKGV